METDRLTYCGWSEKSQSCRGSVVGLETDEPSTFIWSWSLHESARIRDSLTEARTLPMRSLVQFSVAKAQSLCCKQTTWTKGIRIFESLEAMKAAVRTIEHVSYLPQTKQSPPVLRAMQDPDNGNPFWPRPIENEKVLEALYRPFAKSIQVRATQFQNRWHPGMTA